MRVKRTALAALFTAAAVMLFSAVITVSQLPDDLTVDRPGVSELCTLLPVSVDYSSAGQSSAEAKLFGVIGVKKLKVRAGQTGKVRLAGTLFGLKMYSDGVMVVGLSDFSSHGKKVNPAREAGISVGDVIVAVNGKSVYANGEFASAVRSSGGRLELELRDSYGVDRKVILSPAYSDADRSIKTGMWVRDSAAGIGTLTYIDTSSGCFGGLGHGICDTDTHKIVPMHQGEIVAAGITGIRRGVRGAAGEIMGYLSDDELGDLESNTSCGTFGRYTSAIPDYPEYEVARRQEVRPGKAKLLCAVDIDGKPKYYDIVIDKINYTGEPAKNMIITVTDKDLIEKTGGIIQGMSGSPIVQNGKFVGAVTHVFVNRPSSGYAIFVENMMAAA